MGDVPPGGSFHEATDPLHQQTSARLDNQLIS